MAIFVFFQDPFWVLLSSYPHFWGSIYVGFSRELFVCVETEKRLQIFVAVGLYEYLILGNLR